MSEIKDPYTSGHQKKVALLASAISEEMEPEETTGSAAGNQGQSIQQAVPQGVISVSDNSQQNLQGHQHAGSGQGSKQPEMLQQVSQTENHEVEVQINSSGKSTQQKSGK